MVEEALLARPPHRLQVLGFPERREHRDGVADSDRHRVTPGGGLVSGGRPDIQHLAIIERNTQLAGEFTAEYVDTSTGIHE